MGGGERGGAFIVFSCGFVLVSSITLTFMHKLNIHLLKLLINVCRIV